MNKMKRLIEEKREQVEREEERKIMDAIHRQAKDRYYFEKGKAYMKKTKATKKELKQNLIYDTVCFTLGVVALIPMLMLLIVLCY